MKDLYSILIDLGLFSKEIKQRFNNKQIKINGKPIKNLHHQLNVTDEVKEAGEWLCEHDMKFMEKFHILRGLCFDNIGDMFELRTNLKCPELTYLKGFLLLQTDKRTLYILTKNKRT